MAPTYIGRGNHLDRTVPASILMLIGIGLGAFVLEFLVTHRFSPFWWRIEFFILAAIAVAIAYCGYWLAHSDYESRDLWMILGWCVGGLTSGLVLAGGLYVHQTLEQGLITDLPFLFESLALIGAGVGVAFGVVQRSHATRQLDIALNTAEPIDVDALWHIVSLLGGDDETLRQRWTIIELLVTNSVREVPTPVFVEQLTQTEAFPDDHNIVTTLVSDKHLPVLVDHGLVATNDETETIQYVGPESVADYLSKQR